MTKLPKRKVGDKIVAVDDLHWPEPVEAGSLGEIVRVTPDSEFGWYVVKFDGVIEFPAPIYPASDSHIKVRGEE